jgi:broad specificity phosphatase PhoE
MLTLSHAHARTTMPTRVYLIRHAETEVTTEDRFAGSRDLPLNDEGREHAEELGTRLGGFELDAIYSSPLRRALETAQVVAQPHGLEVTVVAALRELDHGHWEGLTRQEVKQRFPQEYAAYERDSLDSAPAGGEPAHAVIERAAPALLEIVHAHPDQTVGVVSHKTTNRLLIAYFLGIDLKRYRDRLGQRPACLNVLDFASDGDVKLMLLNDISHYAICAPPESPYVV